MFSHHHHALFSNNTSPFNCQLTQQLPFGGMEILVVSFFFLFLVVTLTVTFIDVAIKQAWPQTWLDPAVLARVSQIQQMFPQLGNAKKAKEQPWTAPVPTTATAKGPRVVREQDITYNSVVSTAPYLAGLEVDEDLTTILANNDAFSTVSSYCSSSVRGYAMLSSTLLCSGICLGYLWIHNASVYPSWGNSWAGYVELLGFMLVFFTGLIMCGPCGSAVYRNANILLFTSIPTSSSLINLHTFGVGSFAILGLLAHLYAVITQGQSLPDFQGALAGIIATVIGAVIFGLGPVLAKWGIYSQLVGKQVSIIGEILCLFASFISYVQWVTYPSAVCTGYASQFNKAMLAAFAAPFSIFVLKHYATGPTSFTTEPSLMLMNNGTPVATTGPVPVLGYDQDDADLPIVS